MQTTDTGIILPWQTLSTAACISLELLALHCPYLFRKGKPTDKFDLSLLIHF